MPIDIWPVIGALVVLGIVAGAVIWYEHAHADDNDDDDEPDCFV